MKKSFIFVSSAIALMVGGSAFAAELPPPAAAVTGTVNLNGYVTARCSIATTGTPDPIALGELINTSTGVFVPAQVNSKTATLAGWCNGTTSTMGVEAFAIKNTTTSTTASGFVNAIDYTATATIGSATSGPSDTSDSTASTGSNGAGTASTVGLFSDTVTVTLSGASTASGKLVAGDYNGKVEVTLTPGY